jgi:pimeloyl-ACP methyl ester carboxylesterase
MSINGMSLCPTTETSSGQESPRAPNSWYRPSAKRSLPAATAVTSGKRSSSVAAAAPTLVIHGSDDPIFLPACGRDTAASVPNADLMLIDGMGHDLPPALYHTVVEAFDRAARRSSSH